MISSFPSFNPRRGPRGGFTLIELLIVIAIILILIAIALPNFLEAQIRARVTKAKSELRSIHVAMDSYFLDFKIYPVQHERDTHSWMARGLFWLTTPIPYMQSQPQDPFAALSNDEERGYTYITYELGGLPRGEGVCPDCLVTWMMFSNGPNNVQEILQDAPTYTSREPVCNYAATNGTKSNGDIYRWGGDSWWIGVNTRKALPTIKSIAPMPGLMVDGQRYYHHLPPF